MYTEDELLPVSALQHLVFCPRQCALIHIEGLWHENLLTAEGRIMHERTHREGSEGRGDIRISHGLPLRSMRLGLSGIADVVEFHLRDNRWYPFPVEYKRGRPKKNPCDRIQICAQAMCLEEMLDIEVPGGALFYGKPRRRTDVLFDESLRTMTERAAKELHELIKGGKTPPPVYGKYCERCSLIENCMPRTLDKPLSVDRYLESAIKGV